MQNLQEPTYPTCNDHPGDNWDQCSICDPGLPLQCHQVGEERRKEWRSGADGLIERDRQVPEGDIPTDDRAAKDDTKCRDLEELWPGSDGLERHKAHENNGNIAEDSTGRHVAHGEEDWVGECIVGEKELVEEEDSYVGEVPRYDQYEDEEGLFLYGHFDFVGGLRIETKKKKKKREIWIWLKNLPIVWEVVFWEVGFFFLPSYLFEIFLGWVSLTFWELGCLWFFEMDFVDSNLKVLEREKGGVELGQIAVGINSNAI